MINVQVKQFADELSDVLMKMEDLKVEADAIRDAAKELGITVATLNKIAKELITDASRLAKKYASEEQLDMFRAQVGIFKRKGLDTTDKDDGRRSKNSGSTDLF